MVKDWLDFGETTLGQIGRNNAGAHDPIEGIDTDISRDRA
jgi:hypothetical protein